MKSKYQIRANCPLPFRGSGKRKVGRYLLFVMSFLLCGALPLRGQTFNPARPADPSTPYRVAVANDPSEGGEVSGGGLFAAGSSVTIKCSPKSDYIFAGWVNAKGDTVSLNQNYSFTLTSPVSLTAKFIYRKSYTVHASANIAGNYVIFNGSSSVMEGKFQVGTTIPLYAYSVGNFDFVGWQVGGVTVSTAQSYNYMVTAKDVDVVAYYKFNPNRPADPQSLHSLRITSEPADKGSLSRSGTYSLAEGTTTSVTAYNNGDYLFQYWMKDGVKVSTSASYSVTIGRENIDLIAYYKFSPSRPSDPAAPTGNNVFIGRVSEVEQGGVGTYQVFMENTVTDFTAMSFVLTFPAGFTPTVSAATLGSRAAGYTLATTDLGSNAYRFDISGSGPLSNTNGLLVSIPYTTAATTTEGYYPVNFSAASAASSSGITLLARNAGIRIYLAGTNRASATFSTEQFANRVQFTPQLSASVTDWTWDFGDGTTSKARSPFHTYAATGSYIVKLSVTGTMNTSETSQVVTVSSMQNVSAQGVFTLTKAGEGVRSFSSLSGLLSLISAAKVQGDIVVNVESAQQFDWTLAEADALCISLLQSKLAAAQATMTFIRQGDGGKPVFHFVAFDMGFFNAVCGLKNAVYSNVVTELGDLPIDMAAYNLTLETLACSGHSTAYVDLPSVCTSGEIHWQLADAGGLEGYQTSGVGGLPVMTLSSNVTTNAVLTYSVSVGKVPAAGESFTPQYTFTHKYIVRPALKADFGTMSPAIGTITVSNSPTLSWEALPGALSYTLYIWPNGTSRPSEGYVVTGTSYQPTLDYGTTYSWQVVAHGSCDDKAGNLMKFSVRPLPDLQVNTIVTPVSQKAQTHFTVTAKIVNAGVGATVLDKVPYALFMGTSNLVAEATLVAEAEGAQIISAGGYEDIVFNVKAPDYSLGKVYYFVRADYSANYVAGREIETNENNNVSVSNEVLLDPLPIQSGDLAALRNLNTATAGANWTHKWNTADVNVETSDWYGVSFDDDGYVTGIALPANNMTGDLPAVPAFSRLTTLNLSHNALTGDPAAWLNACTALTSVDLSYNKFDNLSAPLASKITNLNLQNQHVVTDFTSPAQTLSLASMAGLTLPTLIAYNHSAGNFSLTPQFYVYDGSNNMMGYLTYSGGAYGLSTSAWKIASDVKAYLKPTSGVAANSLFPVAFTYSQGDANIDANVDILDVQSTLNYFLNGTSGSRFNYMAANAYVDDKLNVQDLVVIVNAILSQTATSGSSKSLVSSLRDETAKACLFVKNRKLWLRTAEPIASADITLSGVALEQLELLLPAAQFQWLGKDVSGGVRFVCFSPAGNAMPIGEIAIADWSSDRDVAVATAALANSKAEWVMTALGEDIVDGVTSVVKDDEVKVVARRNVISVSAPLRIDEMAVTVVDASGRVVEHASSTRGTFCSDFLPKGSYIVKVDTQRGKLVVSRQFKLIIAE